LTIKISLLFGFKALFVFLFPLLLDCWIASKALKSYIVYYAKIPKNRVDDDGIYIIFREGEASSEEAREILSKHNVELREIKWIYIGWSPAAISEKVAKKWGEYLELESRTLKVYLDYYE
jgi:hypothetical protein